MKKVISGVLIAGTLIMSQASCIGSFSLFTKVKDWNESVSSKWVNELIFLVLWILPVYEVVFFLDVILLNSIEFWTGSNPIAMNEGDVEQQLVDGKDGKSYLITATKNQFEVKDVATGEVGLLKFDPENLTWTATENGVSTTIMEGLKDEQGRLTEEVVFHVPNGDDVVYNLNDNNLAGLTQSLQTSNTVFAKN